MASVNVPYSDRGARRVWVVDCGRRYWGRRADAIRGLAIPAGASVPTRHHVLVPLPEWAANLGVGMPPALLVNSAAIVPDSQNPFERCNWFSAAFFHLTGAAEDKMRTDSYCAFQSGIDARLFDYAWVNRIFLLLRRIAARQAGRSEADLFGTLPKATLHLTHDVDAIRKSIEIRLKQTAFHLFNAGRAAAKRHWPLAGEKLIQAARFLGTTPSYWNFETVRRLEEQHGLRSTFNFYGGPAGWRRASLRKMLLDPGYDVDEPALRQELTRLRDGGWRIGVHPSFDAWGDSVTIRREREAVEAASGGPVTECRQHWLRFDWAKTWKAQQDAGLRLDTTLGFNDRPALRNGAALRMHPWDETRGQALEIETLPMMMMDSHFYDYRPMAIEERRAALAHWIGEVRAVAGEASVNWHVHTLAPDYGWEAGYRDLLQAMG